MNISEAQKAYDERMPKDKECEECEKWKRRGDEQYDQLQDAVKVIAHQEDVIESLADRLRERDELIAKYVSDLGCWKQKNKKEVL